MGLTLEEAEVTAVDRLEWRRRVAQYVHMDVRWTKDEIYFLVLCSLCTAAIATMATMLAVC